MQHSVTNFDGFPARFPRRKNDATRKSVPRGGVDNEVPEEVPEYEFDGYDLSDFCVGIYQGVNDKSGIDENEIANRMGVEAFRVVTLFVNELGSDFLICS